MTRRALVLCSIIVAGCSSANAVSSTDPTPTITTPVTTTPVSVTTTVVSTSTTAAPPTTSGTVVSTTLPPASAEPTAAEQAVLDQFTARAFIMMAGDMRALGIAIARHDSIIDSVAFGRRPDGRLLDADAPFRIASISKVLTSVLVLQLADEGVLALDKTLAQLGAVPSGAADPRMGDVTVRQLLQHTSGIGKLRPLFFGSAAATDWHAAADAALRSTLAAPPGTLYAYSNANYVVLGTLVEQLTGQPLSTVVDERVLTPLGIRNATMATTTGSIDPLGPAYVVNPTRRYIDALGPAGSWVVPTDGLARVMAALQPDSDRPLLSPTMLAEMRTPTALVDDEPDWSYGLGLMVFPWTYGHTGTIEDVRTFALVLPNGYSVAVLSAGNRVQSGEALIDAFAAEVVQLAALPTP